MSTTSFITFIQFFVCYNFHVGNTVAIILIQDWCDTFGPVICLECCRYNEADRVSLDPD